MGTEARFQPTLLAWYNEMLEKHVRKDTVSVMAIKKSTGDGIQLMADAKLFSGFSKSLESLDAQVAAALQISTQQRRRLIATYRIRAATLYCGLRKWELAVASMG